MTQERRHAIPAVLSLGVPVLGICYGLQWMTHVLGGHVERLTARELLGALNSW